MSSLINRSVQSSYQNLLHLEGGLTSTLTPIETDAGDDLPISVSTTEVRLDQNLNLNAKDVTGITSATTFIDSAAKNILGFSPVASADSYLVVENGIGASGQPQISVASTETNCAVKLKGKGTGYAWVERLGLSYNAYGNNNRITNLADPTNDQDSVNKRYVDNNFVKNSGSTTGSISMTGTITAGGVITGTSSITVTNNASSNVHYWYQIDGTTRGISYINASTGDMIIHPYNSGGNPLTGSQIVLRAANDGVEIGASVHHSNGDISGSVYGNTWLTTWVNGQAEYYAAAAAAGKVTRDFITVAGWWAGNSLYAYMGDGIAYRSIITSDAGLPNSNSVVNINHGWDETHGSFQWTTLWSTYGYGIYPWVSGRALKEDIKPTEVKAIDKIKAIPLKSFKFKKPKDKDGVESKQFKNIVQQAVPVGVVAEDLETIIPEAVMTRNGQKNINPNAVISYLLKAVQELTARVEELEKK